MVAGANQSWFHLYEVVQPPAVDPAELNADGGVALSAAGTALEQFMQTAMLGEYSARLALLASFRRHAAAQVRAMSMSQSPFSQGNPSSGKVLTACFIIYSIFLVVTDGQMLPDRAGSCGSRQRCQLVVGAGSSAGKCGRILWAVWCSGAGCLADWVEATGEAAAGVLLTD